MLLILSTGCQKENDAEKNAVSPPSNFSSNIDVVFGETNMKAKLSKLSEQKYSIIILTPEILNGMTLDYDNGICKVTYDGLTFETDLKRFPQSEIGTLLTQALDDSDGGLITKTVTEDGNIQYKGITDYGDYRLIQDSETGHWKEFAVDGASLKIIFSDFITN